MTQAKKIALIGYMGSGKSSISKALSKELNLPFFDLDDLIEKQEGMTIPELFKSKGEIYFRKLERKFLEELSASKEHMILAVGGGTPTFAGNMELLNKGFTTVYLKLSIPQLTRRLIKDRSTRPLISHLSDEELPEFIGKHLFERSPKYHEASLVYSVQEHETVDETLEGLVSALKEMN